MQSAISRRFVLSVLIALLLAGGVPLSGRAIYHVVAQVELARLNEERGTNSSLDQDTLSPANWQDTQAFLDAVREAHLAAEKAQSKPAGAQLASTKLP